MVDDDDEDPRIYEFWDDDRMMHVLISSNYDSRNYYERKRDCVSRAANSKRASCHEWVSQSKRAFFQIMETARI